MTEDIDLHLGKRLRRRRCILGMTQQHLASAIGVTFQQIQKYESAANRISAYRLWQLSEALEVPVSYFFDGLTGGTEDRVHPTSGSRELLLTKETVDLVHAYYQLGDPAGRRPPSDQRPIVQRLRVNGGGERSPLWQG